MLRRLTAVTALLFTMFVLGGSPASAQEYAGVCVLTVVPTTVAPGGQVTITGSGFAPNQAVPVAYDGEEFALAQIDGAGNFVSPLQFTIPADTASNTVHSFSAGCDGTVQTATETEITVLSGGQINDATFVLDPNTINCAGRLTGFIERALPNSGVTFSLNGTTIATATSNASGSASFVINDFASGKAAGDYPIVSAGQDGDGEPFQLTATVRVTRNSCSGTSGNGGVGGGSVPRTGSDIGPSIALGSAAIVAGAAFVVVSRRRRTAIA